ncbi:50S ribosomal protein L4 [Candidatus Pacearchaeota archaeon]|nr:50S ribosomal protein L4P [uncultured archaeon]MBS3085440.1 50S ribosomal protein L4 [Candidatus Pacearchaeota archaeon]
MKANILSIDGKKVKEIALPEFFNQPIREDLIFKVLETRKTKQPYAPSPVAGKQHSASGKLRHRRHVWRSQYGRGMSRIPRKIMLERGSQFHWIGAEVASTRGGRRAHPPKIIAMINTKMINKKEAKLALVSALSATANEKEVEKKYNSLKNKNIENLPLIVESKLATLKTKELVQALKLILREDLFEVAQKKKSIRTGRGKMRGRKHKKTAGLLIVIGKNEKLNSNISDIKKAHNISVVDLAGGGQGRLVIYTEQAIKDLEERLEGKEKNKMQSKEKKEK